MVSMVSIIIFYNGSYARGTVKPKNAPPLCYYAYFSNGFARCFLGSMESNFFIIS